VSVADAGPAVLVESSTELAASWTCKVPCEQLLTDKLIEVPEVADGVNTQPVALPTLEKSPAAIPETNSLNPIRNTMVAKFVGEVGLDRTAAVGALPDIVMVVVEAVERLPAASTAYA
jgi:hypothetical protein